MAESGSVLLASTEGEDMVLIGKKNKTNSKGQNITSQIEFEIELMQRHVEMLKAILENEPIGMIRLSEMLGYPQHKVRYSLRLLEQNGLIEPSPGGAVTTKKVYPFLARLKDTVDAIDKTIISIEELVEEVRQEAKKK